MSVALLSDENSFVRENARWALGRLFSPDTTSTLADRTRGDGNVDVRTRASWALAQVNNENQRDDP